MTRLRRGTPIAAAKPARLARASSGGSAPPSGASAAPNPLILPQESIDMPMALGSDSSSERGALRDAHYFWTEYAKKYPAQLSKKNMDAITGSKFRLPKVDEVWVQFHPEHGGYLGDPIEHHHVGQGTRAVPLPEKLHDAYTVFHPERRELGTPEKAGTKDLSPVATNRTERETLRHIKEGRIRGDGISEKTPPSVPDIPPSSEMAALPKEQLRPVDPVTGKVIGETRHKRSGPTLESQGRTDPAHAFEVQKRYRGMAGTELEALAGKGDVIAQAELAKRAGVDETSFSAVPTGGTKTGTGFKVEAEVPSQPSQGVKSTATKLTAAEGELEHTELKGMGLRGAPSQVKLAAYGLGVQIAGGLLTSWMHDKILESVQRMPRPSAEQAHIWSDPAVRSYGALELVRADLPGVLEQLELSLGRQTMAMIAFWRALDSGPAPSRARMIAVAEDEVLADQRRLATARANVAKALALEPKLIEAADAAEALQRIVDNPVVLDQGIRFVGLDLNEMAAISSNLAWYQATLRRSVLAPLHGLASTLDAATRSDKTIIDQFTQARARLYETAPSGR
jgi:hypothetical protein